MQFLLGAAVLARLATAIPFAENESTDAVVYKRTPPMSFDCTSLPDICTSMCWGAYCTQPSFGVTLSFDDPSEATKSSRRTSAGCQPRPNRCSTKGDPAYPQGGYNCDEYPFASTSDADKGGQTNRCVPKSQNSAQGATINNYIRASCNCGPCQFIVGFGNPDSTGVKYCDAANDASKCVPDGNVFKGQNPDVQPPSKVKRDGEAPAKGGMYMTKRGIKVSFGEDLPAGTAIKHARMRRDVLGARDAQDAKSALESRQDSCDIDTGDGDEWDDNPDSKRRRGLDRRTSAADAYAVPEVEFVDDEIDYKMA